MWKYAKRGNAMMEKQRRKNKKKSWDKEQKSLTALFPWDDDDYDDDNMEAAAAIEALVENFHTK